MHIPQNNLRQILLFLVIWIIWVTGSIFFGLWWRKRKEQLRREGLIKSVKRDFNRRRNTFTDI